MSIYLAVAAGGALGAVGRYVVISRTGALLGTKFPFGTLVVNVVGSFLLGVVVVAASETASSVFAFLGVGILGAPAMERAGNFLKNSQPTFELYAEAADRQQGQWIVPSEMAGATTLKSRRVGSIPIHSRFNELRLRSLPHGIEAVSVASAKSRQIVPSTDKSCHLVARLTR